MRSSPTRITMRAAMNVPEHIAGGATAKVTPNANGVRP